jgi:ankyrin repeat protein
LLKHPSVELNTADQEEMTALMIVAKTDRAGAVRELLEHGADKTLLDNKGRTAEDIARLNGHYALATYIREFGNTSADPAVAEVGLPDRFPTSPLTLLTRTTM